MNFDRKKFNELAEVLTKEEPCISIYLPTYRAGHVQEDKIRLKNALAEAAGQLVEGKVLLQNKLDKKAANKMLAPAYDLLERGDFWPHLSDGLALFMDKHRFEYFVVPVDFHPFVYVGKEYYLRHMLPLITGEDRFFLLALSQGEVRFFEGHKHHITPVIIEDLTPENAEVVLKKDQQATLQAHGAGNETTIFHGHGSGKDQKTDDLMKYFRQIDSGLMEMLHDEKAPMVIAAVDYLVPIYREVSNYPCVLDFHISGNPEKDGPVLLHEKAWNLMRPYFESEKQKRKEQFDRYLSMDKASLFIPDVVPAAQQGRIETLFVDKDTPVVWGFHRHLSDQSVKLFKEQNEYNTCLLNYAAVHTWRNGGAVYNIPRKEFPHKATEVNAIYRY